MYEPRFGFFGWFYGFKFALLLSRAELSKPP